LTTRNLHADRAGQPEHGVLHKPVHPSVAFGYADARELAEVFQGKRAGYAYGRQANPTVAALQHRVTMMEDGMASIAFSTGLAAIAAMQPKRSTRIGPAIRHAVRKLANSGNALKVLLIISDGFPQDCDYGPVRGDHEYGLHDTAKALAEAAAKGIETFCVTVDRSGHDYLKRMCPQARYAVIEEVEDLPEALTKVYASLTG